VVISYGFHGLVIVHVTKSRFFHHKLIFR